MSRQIGGILVALLMLCIGAYFMMNKPPTKEENSNVEVSDMYAIDIKTSETMSFVLSEEKPTLIHFWGSWCSPCKAAFPDLIELYSTFGKSVDFVGLASEMKFEQDKMNDIIKKYSLAWTQFCDDKSMKGKEGVASKYGINVYPTYLLLSSEEQVILQTNRIEAIKQQLGELTE